MVLFSDGTLNDKDVTVVVLFEPSGAYKDFYPIVWQCVPFDDYQAHVAYYPSIVCPGWDHGLPKEVGDNVATSNLSRRLT